ncbi:MAG: adenylate/guanylate cyclase domain-containing protein [Gammaproteobacteria bacterium]|nr:adenylate/guanylate cyclase domain-containing protein [Gammaproteobacteria bacterium]MDH3468355.1 adenylate/guanylate cyclase domain-containing protein [Gammaproteobacteria bacterium]
MTKLSKSTGQTVMQNDNIPHVNPVAEWLLDEGWTATDSATLIEGLAVRLVAQGVPLSRLVVFIHSQQPQAMAVRYTWSRDNGCAESRSALHSVVKTGTFRASPVFAIIEGAKAVIRRRLDIPKPRLDYPILKDLLAAGATDYVAMPLVFSSGETNAITFAADQPGGFTDVELNRVRDLVRVLARLLEIHVVRCAAKNILNTYLGKHTGERVLRGLIKRGDGEDIHAVIWFCDLRDSTAMADTMPRAAFLGVLNDFFDCMAGAVLDHGGEVLRFIGDATLAIFATGTTSSGINRGCCDTETACHAALAAAKDAQARMETLNRSRARTGGSPLRFGLALHMGDVTYGNIGVPERLEFTVIGAAANEAARLEGLCKTLDQPLLISSAFEECFPGELISLGFHSLRGVSAPVEIFTLPVDEA